MIGFVGVSGSVVLLFLLITGPQLRAARALLGMEQVELAKRARVARGTIRRMESFEGEIGARTGTLSLVQRTLEKAGVEFLNDGQPGVRLKKRT
jgi:predicted transcriptional regulator